MIARLPGLGDPPGPGGPFRDRILHAAVKVFSERGLAATRVEDILAETGLARRTFYKQFGSKHEVLQALYEVVTQRLIAAIVESTTAGAHPLAAIGIALDMYLEIHLAHPAITRTLIEDSIRSDSPLAPLRARFRKQIVLALDAVLLALTGRRVDRLVSLALISALEGLSLELLSGKPKAADIARTRAVVMSLIETVIASAKSLPAAP